MMKKQCDAIRTYPLNLSNKRSYLAKKRRLIYNYHVKCEDIYMIFLVLNGIELSKKINNKMGFILLEVGYIWMT